MVIFMEIKKKIFFITDVGDGFVNIEGENSFQFLNEKYYKNSIEYGLSKNMKFNEFLSLINKKVSDKQSVLSLLYSNGVLHLEYQRLLNDFDLIIESIDFYFRDKNSNYFNDFNSDIFVKKINLLIDIYKKCENDTIANALDFRKIIEERKSMRECFLKVYKNYETSNEFCFDNIPFEEISFANFCIDYGYPVIKSEYGRFHSLSKTQKVACSLATGCPAVTSAACVCASFFGTNVVFNGMISMLAATCAAVVFGISYFKHVNASNFAVYNKFISDVKMKYFILPDIAEEDIPRLKG